MWQWQIVVVTQGPGIRKRQNQHVSFHIDYRTLLHCHCHSAHRAHYDCWSYGYIHQQSKGCSLPVKCQPYKCRARLYTEPFLFGYHCSCKWCKSKPHLAISSGHGGKLHVLSSKITLISLISNRTVDQMALCEMAAAIPRHITAFRVLTWQIMQSGGTVDSITI